MEIIIAYILLVVFLIFFPYACFVVARTIWLQLIGKGHFIRKTAKKLGISKEAVRDRFNGVVALAQQNCEKWGHRLRFSHRYDICQLNELGACTIKAFRTIYYAPCWIYLVLADSENWTVAFVQSVGHECNHYFDPNKGEGFSRRSKAERRFYHWLCEVRCDFEGVRFAQHFYRFPREVIVDAVDEKGQMYDKQKKKWPWQKKRESMSHPSWERRVALLRKYDTYCEEVIEEVARAAGCTNRAYIAELYSSLLPF